MRKLARPGRLRRDAKHGGAIVDQGAIGRLGAVPFQHGEFGMMQPGALAVAEDMGERKNSCSRPPPAVSCSRIPARNAGKSGEGAPPSGSKLVAKAAVWVSLPGEICKADGSTSTKPWRSKQVAQRLAIRARSFRRGDRAGRISGAQKAARCAIPRPCSIDPTKGFAAPDAVSPCQDRRVEYRCRHKFQKGP